MKWSKALWTKGIICGLLLIMAAIDFFTFAVKPQFQAFDMSALTLLTSNLWLIFLVKFGVIFGLIYLLVFVKTSNSYLTFLWVMVSVYLIIFQGIGAINNLQVAEQNPPPESAPSHEVRLSTGNNFALFWAYYPIAFSMLCFWLWNLGWRKEYPY